MVDEPHEPLQHVKQLRQILSADKLSIGFFLGAGCPCAVRVTDRATGAEGPLIPDIRGLTDAVDKGMLASTDFAAPYTTLVKAINDDGEPAPTVEVMLNRIRALRDVAGKARVRNMSFDELEGLDREICNKIRKIVTSNLPTGDSPYRALAGFIRTHRYPFSEIFTTNYDVLIEQALERQQVPYFDGFVGSARPFFDQRAIEDGEIPERWSRLWKLHGSINWRYNKTTKAVVRSELEADGDEELLIHPSHMKYDESRRMPYFVMIDRLRTFLRHKERPVALIILGYSFRDQHLNEAIIESLKANASSACFAMQFGNLEEYKEATALAKDNANLSLFARDKAIVRRREGPWVANPTTVVSELSATFEKTAPAAAGAGGAADPAEVPQPCKFVGGDFKRFGDFLDQLSAYGSFGTAGA